MLKIENMKEYYKDLDLEMLIDNITIKEKVFKICNLHNNSMLLLISELIYINKLIKEKLIK